MSSEIDLRATRSLELLARLKDVVTGFTKREEQLTRELGTRRYHVNRDAREESERLEGELAAKLEATQAFYEGEDARARALHEARRVRIQQFRAAQIRDIIKEAQRARERWMGDLQMRHLQAERNLPGKLKENDDAAKEAGARLAEQQAILVGHEHVALRYFAGYAVFKRLLRRETAVEDSAIEGATAEEWLGRLQEQVEAVEKELGVFRGLALPKLFSMVPLPAVILFLGLGAAVVAFVLGLNAQAFGIAGGFLAIAALIAWGVHALGAKNARPAAEKLAGMIGEARRLHAVAVLAAKAAHAHERQRILDEHAATVAEIDERWNRADEIETEFSTEARQKIENRFPPALERNARMLAPKLRRIEAERVRRLEEIKSNAEEQRRQLAEKQRAELAALEEREKTAWAELEGDWRRETGELFAQIDAFNAAAAERFPGWQPNAVEEWTPATEFTRAAKFGRFEIDLTKATGGLPKDPRLSLNRSPQVALPLTLAFPEQGSLLFEVAESGNETVTDTLNNVILQLLATMPPGKVTFTIIDPVGLGQNFAGLMHLGDYEESLINRRIWTQRDHIEDRLAELNEHIEKVIQMYLRNEFATITEYNAQAGSVAEKYHFLVLADFPANFSETAAKRLQSIVASGPRCGVFTLMHWDPRQPAPDGLVPSELRQNCLWIRRDKGGFILNQEQAKIGAELVFDPPPSTEVAASLIHRIGKSSVDSNRVEVPFKQVAPAAEEMWTNDTSSELRVAIGRTGATKLQYLAIGKGTRQHALFAGKTGSGKSTLFHVIITNLALSTSPEQVEFYLIDFKKGVEFKCYATKKLPHARVVAIESDREFGLSVLQRVDDELKRRGDMFRKLGVQDIAGYKKAGGTEPVPRSLLIIDEFQEFFVEDDAIAQAASVLFDRIVRQGRAFGIHVLLGSQTLGGAYTLARATLGQMVIRVALQCNEADAYLIMDDNNAAPRLLSRPGEGIYNDAAGAVEGNSPFQVVWLPDEERDEWLDKVHELAERHPEVPFTRSTPIVFEGNAPADLPDNDLLRDALEAMPSAAPAAARCWLGAPNSIKGPTEAVFHRQSGNHLLIVGQREDAATTMLGVSMIALAAQYPVGAARFVLIHSGAPGTPDSDFFERVAAMIPHGVTISRGHDLPAVMNELGEELKARSARASEGADGSAAPATFVFIHGLQRFKKLRAEDDFSFSLGDSDSTVNPATQLNELICEGSAHGMHIVVTVDTFNNVNRFMSRKALTEFEMRVVFQMSANDSASLIDSPRASGLGLHRALLYNEQQGTLETFRPYAMPPTDWLDRAAAHLAKRQAP